MPRLLHKRLMQVYVPWRRPTAFDIFQSQPVTATGVHPLPGGIATQPLESSGCFQGVGWRSSAEGQPGDELGGLEIIWGLRKIGITEANLVLQRVRCDHN